MADAFYIEVDPKDLAEVSRRIRSLVHALESRDVEDVLFRGARIVRDEVKRRAPQGPTGNLKRGAKASRGKRRGKLFATAFAAMDRKRAPHSHLVEYGTDERRPRRKKVMYDSRTGRFYGRRVGPMPARPFFVPAVQATETEVGRVVSEGLKRLLEGVASK